MFQNAHPQEPAPTSHLASSRSHAGRSRVAYPAGKILSTWPKVQQEENANYPAPLAGEPHFYGAIAAVVEAGAGTLAAVSRDGTLRVVDLAEGVERLRYDADNALVDLAAAADGGFWAVNVSGRLLRLEAPQRA
ncbi:hypothetical protein [Nannocystis pusilla]|uniref:hypothetical protein n=1 Tax=Nannocystis pusilla TaxID=889268 RepID=UPI003DA6B4FA